MDFALRRHHLIEEAKVELDVAYEEVKRAEQKIMEFESLYNQKSKHLNGSGSADQLHALMAEKEAQQDQFGIDELYTMQRVAIQRFAQISSVFTIVHSVESTPVAADLIRQILFRADDTRARRVEIDRAIRDFAGNLRAYSVEESTIENDRKVRDSWNAIEVLLQEIGRPDKRGTV
ncbi:MAG: hypothetical protein GKS00_23455 [Alphaproteobacteria bacterium]|nr:hypothetical protein [Alphaproteobacteria bacterium]